MKENIQYSIIEFILCEMDAYEHDWNRKLDSWQKPKRYRRCRCHYHHHYGHSLVMTNGTNMNTICIYLYSMAFSGIGYLHTNQWFHAIIKNHHNSQCIHICTHSNTTVWSIIVWMRKEAVFLLLLLSYGLLSGGKIYWNWIYKFA